MNDQRNDEVIDYILNNEANYTREAINQKLLKDGVSREELDAVWKAIDLQRVAAQKLESRSWVEIGIGFYIRMDTVQNDV